MNQTIQSVSSLFRSCLSSFFSSLFFRVVPEQSRFAPGASHRFVCAMMIMVMSASPVTASPLLSHGVVNGISTVTTNWRQSFLFWWYSSGWAAKSSRLVRENFASGKVSMQQGWDGKGAPKRPVPKPERQETQEQRNARIVRVDVFPKGAKVRTNEPLILNAIAYDKYDNPVSGVSFNWSAFDEDRGRSVTMAAKGKFVATMEGKHEVKAEVAGRQAAVKVKVEGN